MISAIIPARGGSKGIPRKNIKLFCGKPLIQWSIEIALSSPSVDRVIVSTEDPEIGDLSKRLGAEVPFLRPRHLAADSTPGVAPVLHLLESNLGLDDVLLLQPTSPLRRLKDIESIVKLRSSKSASSAVSVTPCDKNPSWMFSMENECYLKSLLQSPKSQPRQQLPSYYAFNGSLYLATSDFLLREKSFFSPETVAYVMPQKFSVDIDTPLDWDFAEFLFSRFNSFS